jgi:hypothetical protein
VRAQRASGAVRCAGRGWWLRPDSRPAAARRSPRPSRLRRKSPDGLRWSRFSAAASGRRCRSAPTLDFALHASLFPRFSLCGPPPGIACSTDVPFTNPIGCPGLLSAGLRPSCACQTGTLAETDLPGRPQQAASSA